MRNDLTTEIHLPVMLTMMLAAARVLATTRRDWQRAGRIRLTPPESTDTVAASLIADAGETGPRMRLSGKAPAPKVYRPGNSQAKGPHRIGLSGE
jgi:hypothetical protein